MDVSRPRCNKSATGSHAFSSAMAFRSASRRQVSRQRQAQSQWHVIVSPRPDDVRLRQMQHEKTERIKQGVDRLERHPGKKTHGFPQKGGTGRKGVWGSSKDDITDYMKENEELA